MRGTEFRIGNSEWDCQRQAGALQHCIGGTEAFSLFGLLTKLFRNPRLRGTSGRATPPLTSVQRSLYDSVLIDPKHSEDQPMKHARFSVISIATVLFLGAFSMTTLSQSLLTQKAISMELAQTIAQAAIAKCRADGFHISVTVLDGGGALKTFIRDDGASLSSIDVSRRKAYTALVFRVPSADTAKRFAASAPVPAIDGTIFMGGGLPIKAGEETIGGVGVSGASEDEVCAAAGVAKVADKLK